MSPAASWTLIGALIGSAYGLVLLGGWCLARAAALADAAERKMWRTLWTKSCREPACRGRVWERIVRDFDPDLGFVFDRPETCPACRAELNSVVEIDFEKMTATDIRLAFDRGDAASCSEAVA